MRKNPVLQAFARLMFVVALVAAVHFSARFIWGLLNHNDSTWLDASEKTIDMSFASASWASVVVMHIVAAAAVFAACLALSLLGTLGRWILFGSRSDQVTPEDEDDFYDPCTLSSCRCSCHKGERYDPQTQVWTEDPTDDQIVERLVSHD